MFRRASLVVAVVAISLAACGGDDDPAPATGACHEAADGQVEIAAVDVAWDTDCLQGPADEPLTIVVDNRDEGVNHNLHLTDAPGEPTTDLEPGPVTQELVVTLPAGEHRFVCDIHPNMVGTLELEAASTDG
jgi:plastocyanin